MIVTSIGFVTYGSQTILAWNIITPDIDIDETEFVRQDILSLMRD